MTVITPDRTETVRGQDIRTVTRGKPARFIVVASETRRNAPIAHLIEMGPENEMATAFPLIEWFATEAEARAAFRQIPANTSPAIVSRL